MLNTVTTAKPKQFNMKKKELKRIDWKIVKRLTLQLYYNNKEKKTNIAMRCNLSYDKFALYLGWMETMDLIKKEIDGEGYELINLNDRGRELFIKIID